MNDLGPDAPGTATPDASLVARVNRFRVVLLDRLDSVETELEARAVELASLRAATADELSACQAERDQALAEAAAARADAGVSAAEANVARADVVAAQALSEVAQAETRAARADADHARSAFAGARAACERAEALAAAHGAALAQIYGSRSWRLTGLARLIAGVGRRAPR